MKAALVRIGVVAVVGLLLYYSSGLKSYVIARPSRSDAFGPSQEIRTASELSSGGVFFVVESDDQAFYLRYSPSANDARIVSTPLQGFGFGDGMITEHPATHVAGKADENPVLNSSQTNMYFLSDRSGGRFWVARRAAKSAAFGAATPIPELDDVANDVITWASDDDCEVWLNRSSHIFFARRPL